MVVRVQWTVGITPETNGLHKLVILGTWTTKIPLRKFTEFSHVLKVFSAFQCYIFGT